MASLNCRGITGKIIGTLNILNCFNTIGNTDNLENCQYYSSTSQKLIKKLPVAGKANCWGKEVYFSVPVSGSLAPDATDIVEPGTICFGVEGSCLAIPFGPTPASRGDECRLVTRVNIVGKLEGELPVLNTIKAGDEVRVESID